VISIIRKNVLIIGIIKPIFANKYNVMRIISFAAIRDYILMQMFLYEIGTKRQKRQTGLV